MRKSLFSALFSSQGLAYKGGFLYETTGLFGGKSTVRKVETETGKVLQSVKLEDKYFGEGMVILGNKVGGVWRVGWLRTRHVAVQYAPPLENMAT